MNLTEPSKPNCAGTGARGLRVLIAEDEALVANVIEYELGIVGAKTIAKVSDGRQAVKMALELRPDVILMDIEMPEVGGLAAAREIREYCPTAIVMLTVYSDLRTISQAVEAGVGAYLVKPPHARELERAMLIARARLADLLRLQASNASLQAALQHVKRLEGLLPVCMYCHKIRRDDESWEQLEQYVSEHSEAVVSHTICPECAHKEFPQIQ